MTLVEKTADCIRRHEKELREAYDLYSSVSVSEENSDELWFLSRTLTGLPSTVCAIEIVENYRNGQPISFRSRSIKVGVHREFRRLCNTLYAKHRPEISEKDFRDSLENIFDLRKTGQLGVVVIDLIDREIIDSMELDEIQSVEKESSAYFIYNREFIFEVNSDTDLIYSFETGGYGESRYFGINTALEKNLYSTLQRTAVDPRHTSVKLAHKNRLRHKKSWTDDP